MRRLALLPLLWLLLGFASATVDPCAAGRAVLDDMGVGGHEMACIELDDQRHAFARIQYDVAAAPADTPVLLGWGTIRRGTVQAAGAVRLQQIDPQLRARLTGDSVDLVLRHEDGGWLRVGIVNRMGEDFRASTEHAWLVRVARSGRWRSGPVVAGDRSRSAMGACWASAQVQLVFGRRAVRWTWTTQTGGDGEGVSPEDRAGWCSASPGTPGHRRLRTRALPVHARRAP